MHTALKTGEKIVFIGDSITDCGRREPQTRPMGCGYVSFVRDFLLTREPEKDITVINTGIGGNTIEDLRNRWEDDALNHRPDWLSIKIGINDCNRYLTNPESDIVQSPESYAVIYDQILTITREQLPEVNLLLIDPFFGRLDDPGVATHSYQNKVSNQLSDYISTVARMAKKYSALHVPMHDLFQKQFRHHAPSTYFPHEPVHPNQSGHMFIAEAVWSALSKD